MNEPTGRLGRCSVALLVTVDDQTNSIYVGAVHRIHGGEPVEHYRRFGRDDLGSALEYSRTELAAFSMENAYQEAFKW